MKRISGIILAAGKSSRMGYDKALISIDNEINVIKIINKIALVTQDIAVIASDNYNNLKKTLYGLKRISVVKNPNPAPGMFSSIKVGVDFFINSDFIFLQPVDNMFVPKDVYKILYKNLSTEYDFIKPYIIDNHQNKRGGHPIIITKSGIKKIMLASVYDNLKNIMRGSKVKFIKVGAEEILLNINTKEELNKYLEKNNGNNQN